MKAFFKKQSNVFWIVQITGWALFFGLILSETDYSVKYKTVSFFSGVFQSIVATSILRYYIKYKVSLKGLNSRVLFNVFVGMLITIIAYLVIGNISGEFLEKIFSLKGEFKEKYIDLDEFEKLITELLGAVFLIGSWTVLYIVIKLILKSNEERLERLELTNNLREAQLNTLKGQINPHFMFNSLNNIRGLMLEDVDKSRDMLTKLSDMLRYSLTKNDGDSILLEEELEMVDNYIALSKIQMEDRLQFNKQITENLKTVSIPPMLIQLLVENAAKHGIANQKNGGIINLIVDKVDNNLIIEVRNTGTINISKESTQLGLDNIKQRLRLLYGEKASFSLNELNNEVVATVKINGYEDH